MAHMNDDTLFGVQGAHLQPGQDVVGVADGLVLQVQDEHGQQLRRLGPRLCPPVPQVTLNGLPQIVEDPLNEQSAAEAGAGGPAGQLGIVTGRVRRKIDLLLDVLVSGRLLCGVETAHLGPELEGLVAVEGHLVSEPKDLPISDSPDIFADGICLLLRLTP